MDTSIFLTVIIFLVSTVIIAVGAYVILVLREVKNNLQRMGHILDHVESLVDTIDNRISTPASSVIGILAAIKEGLALIKPKGKEVKGD